MKAKVKFLSKNVATYLFFSYFCRQ